MEQIYPVFFQIDDFYLIGSYHNLCLEFLIHEKHKLCIKGLQWPNLIRGHYPDELSYMNTRRNCSPSVFKLSFHIFLSKNQPIRDLDVCNMVFQKGIIKILLVGSTLAGHRFIWTWHLIRFCQILGGRYKADFNQIIYNML